MHFFKDRSTLFQMYVTVYIFFFLLDNRYSVLKVFMEESNVWLNEVTCRLTDVLERQHHSRVLNTMWMRWLDDMENVCFSLHH